MNGKNILNAGIEVVETIGGSDAGTPATRTVHYTIKMQNVLVSSYRPMESLAASDLNPGVKPDAIPVEMVSLNFQKIKMDYNQLDANGALVTTVSAGWDLATNKKL